MLRPLLIRGVEHAEVFKTRATEYSKAATRGNWDEVWDAFDGRRKAKTAPAANEDAGEMGLFGPSGVAAK